MIISKNKYSTRANSSVRLERSAHNLVSGGGGPSSGGNESPAYQMRNRVGLGSNPSWPTWAHSSVRTEFWSSKPAAEGSNPSALVS